MLEKIQIRGHGANEKLDIEFGPNVTCIVGKSFTGKSWALRALRWVCLNKPAGDSFINWDSDEAKIRLSIDGKKVTRIRRKNENGNGSFRLSGTAKPYTAFGNDVPRDIAELVNISDKVNFQGQHSPPFWFCETAGEVSRQLNTIVNLEVIDSTLANIASELRDINTIIKLTEKSLKESIVERKELEYVKDLDIGLKHVENLQKIHQADIEKHVRIDEKLDLVAKYVQIRDNRSRLVSDGLSVLSLGDSYRKTAALAENLSKMIETAQNLQNALKNRPPSIRPLEKLKEKTEQLTIRYNRLDSLIESIESRREKKCQIEKEIERLKKSLEEIAEGRCPLCGAKTEF